MFPIEIDVVAININAVERHDLTYLDEDDDGVICCGEVRSKEQLDALMKDDYITIRIVYIDNKYKDTFKEFVSFPSAPTAFAIGEDENNMQDVLAILTGSGG